MYSEKVNQNEIILLIGQSDMAKKRYFSECLNVVGEHN